MSDKEYRKIISSKIVDSIYSIPANAEEIQKGVITTSISKYSNRYYFGPIKIPTKKSIIDNDILLLISHISPKLDLGQIVNDDYYFCIGDNFPEAQDSRFIGLIPKGDVIGLVSNGQNN